MIQRNLQEWLQYWMQISPKEVALGLPRIREVALRMGLIPVDTFLVTVAGTNGKGSTVAFIESILFEHGMTVGVFTSPHIFTFNERIRIGKKAVEDEAICAAFDVVEKNRDSIILTYFEASTLAALYCIKKESLDIAVLETGLGGRLDAVNILDADVSIITGIDIDHTEWLGTTRESIGREKAGIMRRGKPCVCADQNPPRSILEHASKEGAILKCVGRDYTYHMNGDGTWDINLGEQRKLRSLPRPRLFGDIQMHNLSCAICALDCFSTLKRLDEDKLRRGILRAEIRGRFQVEKIRGTRGNMVTCVFDVAHNVQSSRVLRENLSNIQKKGKLLAVFALLLRKDAQGIVLAMTKAVDAWFISPLKSPQTYQLEELSMIVQKEQERSGQASSVCGFSSVEQAFQGALEKAQEEDIVVVFGSMMTVAEAMQAHLLGTRTRTYPH